MLIRNVLQALLITSCLSTSLASRCVLASDGVALPELTPRQEAREKAFVRAHYFQSACFRKARRAAPLLKDNGAMVAPAYTVEMGMDDVAPDGKLHEIEVTEDHRLAYFQESTGIVDSQSSPWYGPVSLEACMKEVLTRDVDN